MAETVVAVMILAYTAVIQPALLLKFATIRLAIVEIIRLVAVAPPGAVGAHASVDISKGNVNQAPMIPSRDPALSQLILQIPAGPILPLTHLHLHLPPLRRSI
jgi:hypothetical protein